MKGDSQADIDTRGDTARRAHEAFQAAAIAVVRQH